MCATCPAQHVLHDLIIRMIFGDEYRSFSPSLYNFLHSPVRCNCLPQHPILTHPQPMFLPQCQGPSFTPIHNNRQNDSSVYLNLYILLAHWKKKYLYSAPNYLFHCLGLAKGSVQIPRTCIRFVTRPVFTARNC
jgi:hypothetical protein